MLWRDTLAAQVVCGRMWFSERAILLLRKSCAAQVEAVSEPKCRYAARSSHIHT